MSSPLTPTGSGSGSNPLEPSPPVINSPQAPTPSPPPGELSPQSRTKPPSNVRMPPAPTYHRTLSAGGPRSPNAVVKPGSPGSDKNSSPLTSPAGPLSPGTNLGQNAFIFPIRSVFQGIAPAEQTQQMEELASGGGGGGAPPPMALTRSGSQREHNQRASTPSEFGIDDRDAGIQTIAQMLQQGSSERKQSDARGGGGPAVATFSGKTDRASSVAGERPLSAGGPEVAAREMPPAFFSVPANSSREPEDNPFFMDRRRASMVPENSDGQTPTIGNPHRPEINSEDSAGTIKRESPPQNASAQAPGSGLTDPNRAPVGQPQSSPKGLNFRDQPGGVTGEFQSFSAMGDSTPFGRGPATANPPPKDRQPPTTYPDIQAPQPLRSRSRGVARSTTSSGVSRRSREIPTALEIDEEGEASLVGDFSGIVRLAEAGSLVSTTGTGTGTGTGDAGTGTGSGIGSRTDRKHRRRHSPSRSTTSGGPTGARLAQQQRTTKPTNTRDSVRNFVNDQAHTVNLTDPNAPTPSPTPHGQQDERVKLQLTAVQTATTEAQAESVETPEDPEDFEDREEERSNSSLSMRASSEMATASTEEKSVVEEEPIVTFRFEHVATDDGHHVVVGREGKLQRCEDEPITTPGAVQGFGVLIVLEEDYDTGKLHVRQVSENSTELLGLSPRYLFRLDCFTRILTNEQEDVLRDNIEYLPDAGEGKGSVEEEGPQVFLLSGFGEPGSDDDEEDDMTTESAGRRREWTCWIAAHRPKQSTWDKKDEQGQPIAPPELIVLEFELERDVYNPLMQTYEPALSGGDTPDSGSQTTLSVGIPRSNSTSSGQRSTNASVGSTTTVGSAPTPRPHLPSSESSAGSATVMTAGGQISSESGTGSTQHVSLSTRPSSKYPPGSEPMGLNGIDVEVPLERIIESTTNHAKPLRALERMRRTGTHLDGSTSASGSNSGPSSGRTRRSRRPIRPQGSSTGTMDVFAVLGQINEQLGSAPDLETFLKITVGVVQDLCRFHRVLIYQFDEAFNGQVVAELVEWGKTTDLYKGLMFPAADIPAQARQLYMTNKVRLLYDRSQTTARMVLRSKEDLDHPLNMTHCYLRAMSPIHIKYLANMNVRSSMSVSIMAFGQLWGLIACHSYGHHGMRVSFPVRQMMRILSDSISRNIERLSYAQRLHTRKLISTIPSQHHPTGYIVSNADDLLQIFDADSGLLVIGDGCKLLGNNEQGQAMLAIAEFLRIMKFDNLKASNHISKDFPDLVLPRAQDTIAGLLYVPLTAKAGQDFIVFLRKGQVREVQWAGKPYKDDRAGDSASLEPRKSFKMWSETVFGRSRAFTDDQLESAGVLALIYGKFIQVWREKQTAMASNQLTAILLSNTSHAVRTPLSQIINTLELALSGNIEPDVRSMLENSHQASRALLFHVHDLLDLTRIETGNETAFNDPFDLRQSISDGLRLYQTESARRGLEFRVNMAPDVPQQVIGDSRKIKTVISNLVANSVKFTEEGYIEVYCGVQKSENGSSVSRQDYVPIEIVVSDSGCGIPTEKLEAMFVSLEGAEEVRAEGTGLGLGLAVVARIVEQLAGQLRAESEVGVGTRFFFTLQMLVATEGRMHREGSVQSSSGSIIPRRQHGSSDSNSLRSGGSSHVSEIDSFVNDFANSHMLAPVAADDPRLLDAEERMTRPGTFPVTDSSWPVRPSKMDTEAQQSAGTGSVPTSPMTLGSPRVRPSIGSRSQSYKLSSVPGSPRKDPSPTMRRKRGSGDNTKLKVMVVEDDVINSQILQRRLRMDRHSVVAVNNGQEAVDALRKDWNIDAILMDIQMPIMDGRTAASEIRKLESHIDPHEDERPLRVDGRVPIFAVSASLYESDRSSLMQNFDGWLLKPLDFTRVRTLLGALEDPGKRAQEVYQQGHWERGGYFRDGMKPPTPAAR